MNEHQEITFTPLALEAHDLAVENRLLNELQRRGLLENAEQARALLDSFTGEMRHA